MLSLHLPTRFTRFGRLYSESDHAAWAVLAIAVVTAVLIFLAFLSR